MGQLPESVDIMSKYAKVDFELVRTDTDAWSFTWKTAPGVGVDISGWSFRFEANERDQSGTPGNIIVLDAAMTKSNSGLGVTDTLTIPFSISDTTVGEGRYDYDLRATVGATVNTVFKGTLVVTPSEQD